MGQVKDIHKEELGKKIAAGLKSLEEGRFSDGEEFFAQMDAELEEEIHAERSMSTMDIENKISATNKKLPK